MSTTNEWIATGNQLPPDGTEIEFRSPHQTATYRGRFNDGTGMDRGFWAGDRKILRIAFWRPIAEPSS